MPETWTTTIRTITLGELAERRFIPIMIPIGGELHGTTWIDGGDEPLTDQAVEVILAAAAEQGWPEGTTLSISSDYLGGDIEAAKRAREAWPRHSSCWFSGYRLEVTVPGGEPRPVSYYEQRREVRVGLTSSEQEAAMQERWAAAEAAMTDEQRMVRDLRRAEVARRKLHESEQQNAAALRELVLQALDMGMSVVDVAAYTRLSRQRVYQIRDGRR